MAGFSLSVLIPYTGGRVAFVHQSVTEYLAASELARKYQSSPQILKEKLSITRWDQALFLTLSFLPGKQGEVFLNDIINVDFVLALRAAKYLEVGCEKIVSKLLSEIPERIQTLGSFDSGIEWAVQFGLPLSDAHEVYLRRLIGLGDMIGAAGVSRLVELKGKDVKDELLELLVERCSDHNFCCNGIAPALKPFATAQDAKKVVAWADFLQASPDHNDVHGFIIGAAEFLSGLDLSVIRRTFFPTDGTEHLSEIRGKVLCSIIQNEHSTGALDLAGELLCRGITEAATSIYFISNFLQAENQISWVSYTHSHVRHLISALGGEDSFCIRCPKMPLCCTS